MIAAAIIAAAMICGCAEGQTETTQTEYSAADSAEEALTETEAESETEAVIEDGELTAPVFSMESGFYGSDITLAMSCGTSTAKIYYTTDGSDPDSTSTKYTGEITISNRSSEPNVITAEKGVSPDPNEYHPKKPVNKGTVIRAVAVDEDGTVTDISTATYFVGLDYGDIAAVSIITDKDNLYDYETGIYVLGKAYDDWLSGEHEDVETWETPGNYSQKGREWEREAYVQIIEPDGTVSLSQALGIRIMGAASRTYVQKSFRLTARKDYGSGHIDCQLIPGTTENGNTNELLDKYKSFLLRNGGNDCDYTKIRDTLNQSRIAFRSFDTQASRPAVVFINGEYRGLYNIREDYTAEYIEYNYGVDENNVVMVKCGRIEEGEEEDIALYNEMKDFVLKNDMSSAANYEKLCSMLDIDNYAQYCAFNVYIGNEDGIFQGNNWEAWRARDISDEPYCDGKWRFMVYDTEYSAGLYRYDDSSAENNLKLILGDTETEQCRFFSRLLKNKDFKNKFINAVLDMTNYDFEPNDTIETIEALAEKYDPYIKENFDCNGPEWVVQGSESFFWQWVGQMKDYFTGRHEHIYDILTKNFRLSGKTAKITLTAENGSIILNTTPLPSGSFTGKYMTDIPVTATAVPSEGYKFAGWEGISAAEATAEFLPAEGLTVTAVFEKE